MCVRARIHIHIHKHTSTRTYTRTYIHAQVDSGKGTFKEHRSVLRSQRSCLNSSLSLLTALVPSQISQLENLAHAWSGGHISAGVKTKF